MEKIILIERNKERDQVETDQVEMIEFKFDNKTYRLRPCDLHGKPFLNFTGTMSDHDAFQIYPEVSNSIIIK